MTPERWRQIQDLFEAALEVPPAGRAPFLAERCAGDTDLHDEVSTLLGAEETASDSLHQLVGQGAGAALAPRLAPGRSLGPYRLVRELGHGGMGAVYLAVRDDAAYRTQVAIKVLHHGLETASAVARFRDERQILATLEHANIVRLLDGGSTDEGLPYLVMEYVEGVPITRYAEAHTLSVAQRVDLFRKVCAAVEYAHGKLVVHRDLKPGNILVNRQGEPKLLDFGIARLLDEAEGGREAHTVTGMQLLTPGYASPEQVRGEPVSTATDVYALGAVLYELCCGVLPHPAGKGIEALRRVLEVEPPRPSACAPAERRRALAGDLDNILLMALHKDPAGRYPSVDRFADDLRHHLEGMPVVARASTFSYRAGKFARRHRGALVLAALIAAALATATVVALRLAARADYHAHRAERRFAEVRTLANSLLFEVDENIRDLPGAVTARELIVKRALAYLDGLAGEAADDEALTGELALAYMRIGDIQGNVFDPNLGRPDDGLASYTRARAVLAPWANRAALARLEYGMALLHWSKQESAAAIAGVSAALRLVDEAPDDLGLEGRLVARGYLVLAQAHRYDNDRAGAVAAASRLTSFAEGWAKRDPAPEARYWIAVAHEVRALNAMLLDADPDAAVRAQVAASDALRALVAEVPTNAAYRRELFYSAMLVGNLQAAGPIGGLWSPATGDLAAAEAAYREALGFAEQIAARDSADVRARSDLARTRAALAWVVYRRDPRTALGLLEMAVAEYAALPREQQRGAWAARCCIGVIRAREGQREQARAEMQSALAFVEKGELELRCRSLEAEMLVALGEREVAAAGLVQVATSLLALARAAPTDVELAVGLTASVLRLVELRPADGCPMLQDAVLAWQYWSVRETAYMTRQHDRLAAARSVCTFRK